jgi:hypothetical protein
MVGLAGRKECTPWTVGYPTGAVVLREEGVLADESRFELRQ